MGKKGFRGGFTLVELTLSMVFISTLSVAVALIISNSIASYHRGVILNQVNTTGMDLVDDMRASIQSSTAGRIASVCIGDNRGSGSENMEGSETSVNCGDAVRKMVVVVKKASISRNGEKIGDVPISGAFCTGSYSYIWNSGYLFGDDYVVGDGEAKKEDLRATVYYGSEKSYEGFRLLKVEDDGREACQMSEKDEENGEGSNEGGSEGSGETTNGESSGGDSEGSSEGSDGGENGGEAGGETDEGTIGEGDEGTGSSDVSSGAVFSVSEATEEPVDLLAGNNDLALYDLAVEVSPEGGGSNNAYYSVSFILATVQGGINIMADGDYCVPPGDAENAAVQAFNYCAINKFNFASQANGG